MLCNFLSFVIYLCCFIFLLQGTLQWTSLHIILRVFFFFNFYCLKQGLVYGKQSTNSSHLGTEWIPLIFVCWTMEIRIFMKNWSYSARLKFNFKVKLQLKKKKHNHSKLLVKSWVCRSQKRMNEYVTSKILRWTCNRYTISQDLNGTQRW